MGRPPANAGPGAAPGGAMHTHRWSWRSLGLGLCVAVFLSLTSTARADTEVWVNTNSGVYHCPGSQYYGATKRGKYLGEGDAVGHGYRAAHDQPCSPQIAARAKSAVRASLTPTVSGDSSVVWVNTSSNVYHCPGTRYFGATKHGEYMSEAEAIGAGNRAAGGRRC